MPSVVTTSHSTVGLPRESKICRAVKLMIFDIFCAAHRHRATATHNRGSGRAQQHRNEQPLMSKLWPQEVIYARVCMVQYAARCTQSRCRALFVREQMPTLYNAKRYMIICDVPARRPAACKIRDGQPGQNVSRRVRRSERWPRAQGHRAPHRARGPNCERARTVCSGREIRK